jgi:hypothetical protein
MAAAVVIGVIVAATLLAMGGGAEWRARRFGRPSLDRRRALPWMGGAAILVLSLLIAVSVRAPIVLVGLAAYAGFAAFAVWRMATIDRGSSWLPPSRRQARFAFSVIGLTWLGIVLGLLLWIADMVAGIPVGA